MSATVHAGTRSARRAVTAAASPAEDGQTRISMPEVVLGDSSCDWAIALAASALGIAWVLAPVIAGSSLFDFL